MDDEQQPEHDISYWTVTVRNLILQRKAMTDVVKTSEDQSKVPQRVTMYSAE